MKDTNKREYFRNVRLTASESRILKDKAEAEGLKESDYIRYLITEKPINHQEISEQVNKLIYEINKVGNNINQIARVANTEGITEDMLFKVILNLKEIKEAVQKVVTEIGNK